MGIMRRTEIHGESNVWSTAQDRRRSTDLMFMLGLNETMDQLAMANSVRFYGNVLRREDGHIFENGIRFCGWRSKEKTEAEEDMEKAMKRHEESMKIGLRMEDPLCQSKWSVGVNKIAAGLR